MNGNDGFEWHVEESMRKERLWKEKAKWKKPTPCEDINTEQFFFYINNNLKTRQKKQQNAVPETIPCQENLGQESQAKQTNPSVDPSSYR